VSLSVVAAMPGYTLIVPAGTATACEQYYTSWGGTNGRRIWEQLRIEQGRPPRPELTDDYNPWKPVCGRPFFNRAATSVRNHRPFKHKGVKAKSVGRPQRSVEPGSVITVGDEKVSNTSYTDSDRGSFGLGYVRTKAGGAGLKVQVEKLRGNRRCAVLTAALNGSVLEQREQKSILASPYKCGETLDKASLRLVAPPANVALPPLALPQVAIPYLLWCNQYHRSHTALSQTAAAGDCDTWNRM